MKKSGINSNRNYQTRISGSREVDGTQPSGPVTRSKRRSGTSDCASDLSQVATKSEWKYLNNSEDGTSDCASELKMQPQFYVSSKKARGFVTKNKPKNTKSRSKVSEIKEEGIDVPLLRQTIAENVDRYLFDLHELLDAEGLLKPGLFDKVDTLAELFLDDLYGEIEKIV